ncbi:MAG: hypothetical protein RIA64_01530 [Rhodospirillales bacterium]
MVTYPVRTALGGKPLGGVVPMGQSPAVRVADPRLATQPVSPGLALRNFGAGVRDTIMDPRLWGGRAPDNPGKSVLTGGRPAGPVLGGVEMADDGAMESGLALGGIMPPRRPQQGALGPVATAQPAVATPMQGGDPNFIQASTGQTVPARGYMPPAAGQAPQGAALGGIGMEAFLDRMPSSREQEPQGALGKALSDPMFQLGASLMASGSKPGATALGALGESALHTGRNLQDRKKSAQDARWREFEGMMAAANMKNQMDQTQQTAAHRTATLAETQRHNRAQEMQQVRVLEAELAAQGRPKDEGELMRRAKSLAEADPSSYSGTIGEKDDRAVAQNTRKYAAQLAQRYGMKVPGLEQATIPAFDPGDPATAKAGIAQLPDGAQFKLGGKMYIKRGDKLQPVPEGGLGAKPGLGGGNPMTPEGQRGRVDQRLEP